jgi:hypothetical protein
MRTVQLLATQDGDNSRFLNARVNDDGSLVISGQDLGPATAMMSNDGEYEWAHTFPAESVPLLCKALGGNGRDDILDLLERSYTGNRSSELERVIGETRDTIPREFWSWA